MESKNGIVKELIQGEMSAIETYRQALEKVGDEPQAQELRRIESEHRQAVDTLKEKFTGDVDDLGTSGAWGTWAKAVEGTAKLFGNTAAIKALKEGEEHGVKDYERALKDSDLDAEIKQFISGTLLPRTRAHIPVLDRFMQKQ